MVTDLKNESDTLRIYFIELAGHKWVTTVRLVFLGGEFRNIEDFKHFFMAKYFPAKSTTEFISLFWDLTVLNVLGCQSKGNASIQKSSRKNLTL